MIVVLFFLALWLFCCCVVTVAKSNHVGPFFNRLAQTIFESLRIFKRGVKCIIELLYLQSKNRENELRMSQIKPVSQLEVEVVTSVLQDFFLHPTFVEQIPNYPLQCRQLSFISNGLKSSNTTLEILVVSLQNKFQKKGVISLKFGVNYNTSGHIDVFIK